MFFFLLFFHIIYMLSYKVLIVHIKIPVLIVKTLVLFTDIDKNYHLSLGIRNSVCFTTFLLTVLLLSPLLLNSTPYFDINFKHLLLSQARRSQLEAAVSISKNFHEFRTNKKYEISLRTNREST